MPIISITDTTIDVLCELGDESTPRTINIADLVAGVKASKDTIRLPPCAVDSTHVEFIDRTFDNPQAHAGCVNALHRALVDANLIDPDSSAALLAESESDRPSFFYTLSATAIDVGRSTEGIFSIDMAALLSLYGIDTARSWLRSGGIIFTNDSDEAIGSFLSALFPSSEAERTLYGAALRLDKALRF